MSDSETLYRMFTGGDGSRWESAGLEAVGGPSDLPEGVPTDAEEMAQIEQEAAKLRAAYAADPEGVLADLREAFESEPMDEKEREQFRRDVEAALERTDDLEATQKEAEALESLEAVGLPPDFVEKHIVEKYRDPRIEIDPSAFRFEDDSLLGIIGWALFNGPQAIVVPRTDGEQDFRKLADSKGHRFRSHVGTESGFRYELKPHQPGAPMHIALFADFGTGLSHSRYIARQIEVDEPECAIHLGDVYYTGTLKQFYEYFQEPLRGVVESGKTKLFAIPDNHEGYSGFEAYTGYLDDNRRRYPDTQQQEGSYFCVAAEHIQLIGVDTIWNSQKGRIRDRDVLEWLRAQLEAGRENGKANVFLTGHHPYTYDSGDTTPLLTDVQDLHDDNLIDLWFWGNTHYCALYDRTERFPFYGSCIGHAGYPYKRKEAGKKTAAPVLFLETGSRYEPTTIRSDRGMNGYVDLEVANDGSVLVRYKDWMGHERQVERFARNSGEKHLSKQSS